MRGSPKVVYRGNAKKNWNNNSSFKTSGDLPYENNGKNVHPNNQPQNPFKILQMTQMKMTITQ